MAGRRASDAVQALSCVTLLLLLLLPAFVNAQWHRQASFSGSVQFIYFLDKQGAPNTGFALLLNNTELRTTDHGITWTSIDLTGKGSYFRDMVFKDSLNGWMVHGPVGFTQGGGVSRTTDGGLTWRYLPASRSVRYAYDFPDGVYYNPKSKGLFFTGNESQFVSWDDGETWSLSLRSDLGVISRYAFANDSEGACGSGFYYTTDAGLTWTEPNGVDTNSWYDTQPAAIAGTQTYLFVRADGRVCRTDDLWRTRHFLPGPGIPRLPGDRVLQCLRSVGGVLFGQSALGCFESFDTGQTWRSLCGPLGKPIGGDYASTFYVSGKRIYAHVVNLDGLTDDLMSADVDSVSLFTSRYALHSPDGSPSIAYWNSDGTGGVLCRPDMDSLVGVDSVYLSLSYDTATLELQGLDVAPPWALQVDSTTLGSIRLLCIDTSSSNSSAPPILVRFKRSVTAGYGIVRVDSSHLNGHRLDCSCDVESKGPGDSISLGVIFCGDKTLLRFMAMGSPFGLERLVPDPASTEIAVTLTGTEAEDAVRYELYDAIGKRRCMAVAMGETSRLDVHDLPNGIYYLRLTRFHDGATVARSIVITR